MGLKMHLLHIVEITYDLSHSVLYLPFKEFSNMAYMSGVGTRDKWWEWCSITDTAAAGADNCSAQLS